MKKEWAFEQSFWHGSENQPLWLVWQQLLFARDRGLPLRTEMVERRLRTDFASTDEVRGDSNIADIQSQVGDSGVGFVKNKYPYDRLEQCLTNGFRLSHVCLWSFGAELSRSEICQQIEKHYPGQAALVYQNGVGNKSIPNVWHVHVFMVNQR